MSKKTLKELIKKNYNYNKKDTILNSCIKAKNDINTISSLYSNDNEYHDFIKYGNGKLPPSVARIDIPEVITCMTSCPNCYAKKRLFDVIKEYRLKNLINIMHAIENFDYRLKFLKNIKKIFKNHKENYGSKACCRLHASGDIFNFKYFNLILDIISENKNIMFYTYTKNMAIYKIYKELKAKNLIKNLKINCSYIHGHANYYNLKDFYELKIFIKTLKKCRELKETIFLCNYSFFKMSDKMQKLIVKIVKKYNDVLIFNDKKECHCNKNCMYCIKELTTHVAFLEH